MPSPNEILDYERHRGEGMTSALGEYTPEEFWTLLDDYKDLRAAAEKLRQAQIEYMSVRDIAMAWELEIFGKAVAKAAAELDAVLAK